MAGGRQRLCHSSYYSSCCPALGIKYHANSAALTLVVLTEQCLAWTLVIQPLSQSQPVLKTAKHFCFIRVIENANYGMQYKGPMYYRVQLLAVMESRKLYFSSTYSVFHKWLTYHKDPVLFNFLKVDFIETEAEWSKASQNIDWDVQQMGELLPRKRIWDLNESCDIIIEDLYLRLLSLGHNYQPLLLAALNKLLPSGKDTYLQAYLTESDFITMEWWSQIWLSA